MLKETHARNHLRGPGGFRTRVPDARRAKTCGIGTILVSRVAPVSRTGREGVRGKLLVGGAVIPCRLGRGGVVRDKREGDGATPAGTWRTLALWQRRDRGPRVRSGLPSRPIGREDGWCDDPRVPAYNRPVRLPCRASHETLWRADGLYDFVVVLDYNLRHPRPRRGSAIFFHVAEGRPTAGCIAVEPAAMRRLLPRLSRRSRFKILA